MTSQSFQLFTVFQKRESMLDKNDLLSNYLFLPSALWNWTADKSGELYLWIFQKSFLSRMHNLPVSHEAALLSA